MEVVRQTLVGTVGLVVYKVIENVVNIGKKIFFDIICSKIEIIAEGNSKSLYSIKKELEVLVPTRKLNSMIDGSLVPHYCLSYGVYCVTIKDLGVLIINYTKDSFILYNLPTIECWPPRLNSNNNGLKNFCGEAYRKHCAPSEMIMTYTANKDKWSFPIIRRPSNFLDSNLTRAMKLALRDVEIFKLSAQI